MVEYKQNNNEQWLRIRTFITEVRKIVDGKVYVSLGPEIDATSYENAVVISKSLKDYPFIDVIGAKHGYEQNHQTNNQYLSDPSLAHGSFVLWDHSKDKECNKPSDSVMVQKKDLI